MKRKNPFVEHSLQALDAIGVVELFALFVRDVEHVRHALPFGIHFGQRDAEVELVQGPRNFVKEADAAVGFPGGFGTMDELFETVTLVQTGKIHRFPIIAMGSDFWLNMVGMRDAAIEQGTISVSDQELYSRTDDVEEALAILQAAETSKSV